MAASITCPTFRPEYAEATVKMTQRNSPHPTERGVSSGTTSRAGTSGCVNLPRRERSVRILGYCLRCGTGHGATS